MSVSVRIICSDSEVQKVIVTNGIVNDVVLNEDEEEEEERLNTRTP